MELIFEISKSGRSTADVPASDVPAVNIENTIGGKYLRNELDLPEVAEIDLIRHYTNLSRRNFGVDLGFYPLGSCTMKYNPKVNENAAALPGFTGLHPYIDERSAQGIYSSSMKCRNICAPFSAWRNLPCNRQLAHMASLPV